MLRTCNGRLTAAEALGDADVYSTVVALQGTLAFKRGEFARAKDSFTQALAIKRELKNEFGAAEILAALAVNAMRAGDVAEGSRLAGESLETALHVDAPNLVVTALETCALALIHQQNADVAKDAFMLAEAMRRVHSLSEKTSLGRDEAASKLRLSFGAALDERADLPANWKSAARTFLVAVREGSPLVST